MNLSQTILAPALPVNEKEKIEDKFCQPQAFKFSLFQHTKSH